MEVPELKSEIVREIHDHEIFISFNCDHEAVAFHEWLHLAGFKAFEKWAIKTGRDELRAK